MWAVSHARRTDAPPPGRRWRSASSAFGTSTVIAVPSARRTTNWVAVPRYRELSTVPSTQRRGLRWLPSAATSSFSGRTIAWHRSPASNPSALVLTVTPASSFSSPAETIVAGIRFETPMKPATNSVVGCS